MLYTVRTIINCYNYLLLHKAFSEQNLQHLTFYRKGFEDEITIEWERKRVEQRNQKWIPCLECVFQIRREGLAHMHTLNQAQIHWRIQIWWSRSRVFLKLICISVAKWDYDPKTDRGSDLNLYPSTLINVYYYIYKRYQIYNMYYGQMWLNYCFIKE